MSKNGRNDRTHYQRLGVTPDATPEQIRKAFRELAQRIHPDVSDAPDAEARFAEVAEAYEVLSDTIRRRRYDRELAGEVSTDRGSNNGQPTHRAHYTWHNIANDSVVDDGPTEFDEMYDAFFGSETEDDSDHTA